MAYAESRLDGLGSIGEYGWHLRIIRGLDKSRREKSPREEGRVSQFRHGGTRYAANLYWRDQALKGNDQPQLHAVTECQLRDPDRGVPSRLPDISVAYNNDHQALPLAAELTTRSFGGSRQQEHAAKAMKFNYARSCAQELSKHMDWYLVRTKPGKERWVADQLSAILPEVFLPMLEARVPRWGRLVWSVMPLFPCYLFAQFDIQARYFDVKYTAGVRDIVSAGYDPLAVPILVVEEIKLRGTNGIVKIQPRTFDTGQCVRVIDGPFRGFEAIFDRYLSGTERVAILLSTVEANGIRVVVRSSSLVGKTFG